MMDTYTVLKIIGEGSFGRALLVQKHNESQQYVMKEIHLSKNASGLQRSRREAILLAKMKHPNIVAFLDSFEADGHLYIVMEYCDGGDLTQRLLQQKERLFPEEMVLNLFVQICLGMKHIHDKRVLHRDIKSKNIFLTKNGVVKLGDFGSAHLLNSPMAFAHTYVGTPYYVSPEIWENKPYNNKRHNTSMGGISWDTQSTAETPVTTFSMHGDYVAKNWILFNTWRPNSGDRIASDIWALGCVLYELCTLRHPFQSNSWKNLILKICNGSYTPIPRQYSYELQYVIKQMFKRNPKDRPSVSTILARNCFSKLISKFLSPEMVKKEFCDVTTKRKKTAQGKPRTIQKASVPSKCEDVSSGAGGSECMKTAEASAAGLRKWNPAEGESIAKSLAEKTLEETASQMEATPKGEHVIIPSGKASNFLSRKQWNEFPPDTVLNILENAKLTSDMAVEDLNSGNCVKTHKKGPRKQWSQRPPETVLNFLKHVNSNLAFKTYTIDKGASGTSLIGPLSAAFGNTDDVDGEMETIELDPERLASRSDDEDTDFEESDEPDWVGELKKLLEYNL